MPIFLLLILLLGLNSCALHNRSIPLLLDEVQLQRARQKPMYIPSDNLIVDINRTLDKQNWVALHLQNAKRAALATLTFKTEQECSGSVEFNVRYQPNNSNEVLYYYWPSLPLEGEPKIEVNYNNKQLSISFQGQTKSFPIAGKVQYLAISN